MKLKTVLLSLLVVLSLSWPVLFGFGLTAALLSFETEELDDTAFDFKYHWGSRTSSNQILSIPISGIILDNRPDSLGNFGGLLESGVTYGYDVKTKLYRLAEEDEISGLVLEVNSPGGTVTGSNAIAEGVDYYRQTTGKPVIVFASGIMASGSYWAAAPADEIIADTGTLIGSIGVIGTQFVTYENVVGLQDGLFGLGVTTRDGIELTVVSAGEGKDFGNPFRQPTVRELELAQETTDTVYDSFVDFVAARRSLSADQIRNDIGAYVYSEQVALERGLIDKLGNRETSYQAMAEMLEYGRDFKIVREKHPLGFWGSLFMSSFGPNQLSLESSPCVYTKKVLAYYGSPLDLCSVR